MDWPNGTLFLPVPPASIHNSGLTSGREFVGRSIRSVTQEMSMHKHACLIWHWAQASGAGQRGS